MAFIKRYFFVILIIMPFGIVCAQDVFDAEKTYYDAEFLELYNRFEEALPLYLSLIDNDFSNANVQYKTGNAYLHIPGQKTRAIPYLEEAVKNTSLKYRKEYSFKEINSPVRSYLLLGEALQTDMQLDKALDKYKSYKKLLTDNNMDSSEADRHIAGCIYARERINAVSDYDSIKLDLSEAGTSSYRAVLSEDGNSLVFMRKREYYEAVFYSVKKDSLWTKPLNITAEIESDGKYLVCSLSPTGDKLLLSHLNSTDYDLYLSEYKDGRWTKAQRLESGINSDANETHAIFTTDNFLWFVSDRKGGYGGYDIYKAAINEDASFSQPENAGKIINTAWDEATPFFSNNGSRLIFSSKGHNNMGGYDIFHTDKKNGSWSEVVNYGYPLNTTDDDLFFSPAENEFTGIKSHFDSLPGKIQSVWYWEFYSAENPRRQKESRKLISFDKAPVETTVLSHAAKENRLALSPESQKTAKQPLVETQYILNSVLFAFDSSVITDNAKKELDIIVRAMNMISSLNISLSGHTDSVGPAEYNRKLSKRRALSVAAYLENAGIKRERIIISYHGEEEPVALNTNPNGTDCREGRKYNRRVSFSIEGTDRQQLKINPRPVPEKLKL